jgi:hypothetical protein
LIAFVNALLLGVGPTLDEAADSPPRCTIDNSIRSHCQPSIGEKCPVFMSPGPACPLMLRIDCLAPGRRQIWHGLLALKGRPQKPQGYVGLNPLAKLH